MPSRTSTRISILILQTTCLVAACPLPSFAATWRVEQDGSGDFEIIQDALDAAAPGDSILIGAGRFATFRPGVPVADGFRFAAIASVQTTGLTLIGSGPTETIIGAADPVEFDGQLPTIGLHVDAGAVTFVRDVTFENSKYDVVLRDRTIVEDCRVIRRHTFTGFNFHVYGVGVEIRRTKFAGLDQFVAGRGARELLVEDCMFEERTLNGVLMLISYYARDCMVRRTRFVGGAGAIQFGPGGTGWLEDCTIEGVRVAGIIFDGEWAQVRRCHIGTTRMGISAGQGRLEVYDTMIEGGTQTTIFSGAPIYVRNSHILNVGAPSIRNSVRAWQGFLDVRENWWGTEDESLIASWIEDEYGTVLWQPILTGAVSSEQSSIGELKGWFGHEE